ncbi:MAG: hypothetical protein PWQ95_309 [Thermococcaceae archaeon]|nr:hypothetical protein [Thermococcaceae archaeon]
MKWATKALIVAFIILFGIAYSELGKNLKMSENSAPPALATAVMKLDKTAYKVGENLTLTITNTGNEAIIVGEPYRLYRLENVGWKEINTGLTFTMIGWTIPPGGNWTQRVPLFIHDPGDPPGNLRPLPPGKYRITKTLSIHNGKYRGKNQEITLSAEFEITG